MSNANELFEAELRRRGLSFERGSAPNQYVVTHADTTLNISLDNLARTFARDGDADSIVGFVDAVVAAAVGEELPWNPAHLYWSVEQRLPDAPELVVAPVTKSQHLVRVLVMTDADHRRLTFVTAQHLRDWQVDRAAAARLADQNLSKLLTARAPEVEVVHGAKLAMLPLQPPFKASVLFAPGFKQFITQALGWPVMAVLPCRDFVFVVEATSDALLEAMGEVVQREYRTSGYPLSTEVFRIDDDGAVAIGAFPE